MFRDLSDLKQKKIKKQCKKLGVN